MDVISEEEAFKKNWEIVLLTGDLIDRIYLNKINLINIKRVIKESNYF